MNTYCINLKQRKAKWNRVQLECEKLNLNVTRFEAIFDTYGHGGCFKSHIELLKQAKHEGVFMIIEDDILVLEPIEVLEKAIEQLPSDWDMLYLGAQLSKRLERYSDNLLRLSGALMTHAVIYNNQNGIADYIIENARGIIDVYLRDNVHEQFDCFITYPMVCSQADGYSDTIRWWKQSEDIEKRYKKFTIYN